MWLADSERGVRTSTAAQVEGPQTQMREKHYYSQRLCLLREKLSAVCHRRG